MNEKSYKYRYLTDNGVKFKVNKIYNVISFLIELELKCAWAGIISKQINQFIHLKSVDIKL